MKGRRLGKGLSALMGGSINELENNNRMTLDVRVLFPSEFQPRRVFDEVSLGELSTSIKVYGVMQPIIVRLVNNEKYEIIAGERRWRAAKMAGLNSVPVIVYDMSDKQCLEFSLIENIQRKDLTPIEEACAYKRLIDLYSYTHEELASIVGKSRSHITNLLRFLGLPKSIQEMLDEGVIGYSHARAIMCSENPKMVAESIVKDNLNVRETEQLIREELRKKKQSIKVIKNDEEKKDRIFIESSISKVLNDIKVVLLEKNGTGKLVLHFKDISELKTILNRLGI